MSTRRHKQFLCRLIEKKVAGFLEQPGNNQQKNK
jgi:hypothetical protein